MLAKCPRQFQLSLAVSELVWYSSCYVHVTIRHIERDSQFLIYITFVNIKKVWEEADCIIVLRLDCVNSKLDKVRLDRY
jgi:hypothetical protein